MIANVQSSAVLGIDAYRVGVDVEVSSGFPMMAVVGLSDAAANETRERVRAAIKNSGFLFPHDKCLTVSLTPVDVRKVGASFDLSIAVGVLIATGQVPGDYLMGALLVGELSPEGSVLPVTGVLPIAIGARERNCTRLFVPAGNAREAAIVPGMDVYPVSTLKEIARAMVTPDTLQPMSRDASLLAPEPARYELDFADVKGYAHVKRALEVAAAGGHNVILFGPPSSGKTMMARCLPSILPPLSVDEALELTKLYSVAGMLPPEKGLANTRPFRSVDHTVPMAAFFGGGAAPRPGEVSLAHRGVLFLEDLPEFRREALEALRQPLEDGVINVSRVSASYTYPADFCLVAATNPCPCGYYGDTVRQCSCTSTEVLRYQKRISGPALDSVDMHVEVRRPAEEELLQSRVVDSSAAVRERVCRARLVQAQRFAATIPVEAFSDDGPVMVSSPDTLRDGQQRPGNVRPLLCNAQMGAKEIRAYCAPSESVKSLLRAVIQQLGLSARAYDRLLKVARTVADLGGQEHIQAVHIAEALQYRSLDRRFCGK